LSRTIPFIGFPGVSSDEKLAKEEGSEKSKEKFRRRRKCRRLGGGR